MTRHIETSHIQKRNLVLIVCCGYTEKYYFENMRRDLRGIASVKVKLIPKDPNRIIEKVSNIPDITEYDKVWIVIDKDDFGDIKSVIRTAKSAGYFVIFSNPCFELWILLHFQNITTPIRREDMPSMVSINISKLIGSAHFRYNKSDRKLYDYVKQFQEIALRRSRKLMGKLIKNHTFDPDNCNPLTNMHLLLDSITHKS